MTFYDKKMFSKMHFWQKSKKYGWKAGVCFRYQNNKALVPSSPNFMIIAKKFNQENIKIDFYVFFNIFWRQTAKTENI